jgi:hypothetical protein
MYRIYVDLCAGINVGTGVVGGNGVGSFGFEISGSSTQVNGSRITPVREEQTYK